MQANIPLPVRQRVASYHYHSWRNWRIRRKDWWVARLEAQLDSLAYDLVRLVIFGAVGVVVMVRL